MVGLYYANSKRSRMKKCLFSLLSGACLTNSFYSSLGADTGRLGWEILILTRVFELMSDISKLPGWEVDETRGERG